MTRAAATRCVRSLSRTAPSAVAFMKPACRVAIPCMVHAPAALRHSPFPAWSGLAPSARQIGGVFAAEPHAAAALQALIPALVGLALLWAALSWLLLAAAAQFAHSESELLTITPAAAAAASAAGEPGNLPPVQVVANWLERHVFRKAAATGRGGRRGGGASTDPLLGNA